VVKKIIKILFILSVLFALILGGVLLFLYKNQDFVIQKFIQASNSYLKAEVRVKSIKLDLFSKFPDISIDLKNPIIFDAIENSKDTLFIADNLYLTIDVKSLLKNDVVINKCFLENAVIKLKIDAQGNNNYTIFKTEEETQNQKAVKIALKQISLDNVLVSYIDMRTTNNHTVLAKKVEAHFYYEENLKIGLMGDLFVHHLTVHDFPYLRNKNVSISTQMMFEDGKLAIEPSLLNITGIDFNVSGHYVTKEHSFINLHVSAPKANIQTLLALIPGEYTRNIMAYQSKGMVYFRGAVVGRVDPGYSPKIDFKFGCRDLQLYHPESKQYVKHMYLNGSYTNGFSHNAKTSELKLDSVQFMVAGHKIAGDFKYRNFDDPHIHSALTGVLDLESALQLFPVSGIQKATGQIKANVLIEGLVRELKEFKNSEKILANSTIEIENVNLDLKDQFVLHNINGKIYSKDQFLIFENMQANVGKSDFKWNGRINNAFKWLFSKEEMPLSVTANVNSTLVDLDELLKSDEQTTKNSSQQYSLHISEKWEFYLNCKVDRLKFRRLQGEDEATNVRGSLVVKDKMMKFKDLGLNIAKGEMLFDGDIDARQEGKLLLQLRGDIKQLDVEKAFYVFENFNQHFITDKNLRGKLSADYYLYLPFNTNFTLDLADITTVIHTTIDNGKLIDFKPMEEMGVFLKENKYEKYVKSKDFKNVSFSRLENTFSIHNKTIEIPEMRISSSLADLTISGTHHFDGKMDYYVSFPLINYQKRSGDELNGVSQSTNKKEYIIYLEIVGTSDKYEVIFDKKKTIETVKEKLLYDVKQIVKKDEERQQYIKIDTQDSTSMMDFDDF